MRRNMPLAVLALFISTSLHADEPTITLERKDHWLILHRPGLPGGPIRINYLEAYCRPNSTDREWGQTVIKHRSEMVSMNDAKTVLKLKDVLADGVVVDHTITAKADEVDFRISANNPTNKTSEAHWAQPCVRLAAFTGFGKDSGGDLDDYLPKCFVFLNGELKRMPTADWAKQARYTPGQVWCPAGVPRTDVNPRPLSKNVTSHGLIGCFSADEKMIFAIAFEPYQELFQGVARCLHSDFRIGGLKPDETKTVRGKIYLVPSDASQLRKRFEKDFPK